MAIVVYGHCGLRVPAMVRKGYISNGKPYGEITVDKHSPSSAGGHSIFINKANILSSERAFLQVL